MISNITPLYFKPPFPLLGKDMADALCEQCFLKTLSSVGVETTCAWMQGHFDQGLWESGLVDTFLFYSGHLNEGVIGEASDRPLFLLCVLWEFETSDLWFDTSLSLQNSWAGAECGCWG